MENNQYTGDSWDRGMFYGIYTLWRQKPFITYQLQMLKNNTVESINMRNKLTLLQEYSRMARTTQQMNKITKKNKELECRLIEFKSPEMEYEVYV